MVEIEKNFMSTDNRIALITEKILNIMNQYDQKGWTVGIPDPFPTVTSMTISYHMGSGSQ